MKLYIQYKFKDCGKSKFLQRLIPELEKLGVQCSFESKKPDVALILTRFRDDIPKCPKVIRIDGIPILSHQRDKWVVKKKIGAHVNKCQAIIYQSHFAQTMVNAIMKPKVKKQYVVWNGASPEEFDVEPNKSDYEKNIIICSKWYSGEHRPWKRLREMWEVAVHYVNSRSPNTCFWIIGEIGGLEKDWPTHDRIKFTGYLPNNELKHYLKMGDIMLHLSWFSWCDNALIEAIHAGCYPITNNVGGNPEFVKACGGMALEIDEPIKAERMKKYIPPKFNIDTVMNAIDDVFITRPMTTTEPIHIKNIAKQYYDIFKKVAK